MNLWTETEIAEVVRLRDSGMEWDSIGETLDRNTSSCRRQYGKAKADEPVATESRTFTESGDAAESSFVTMNPVRTLEDAIRVAKVDTSEWKVDSWTCSQWTVPIRVKGSAVQTQQYRVSMKLRRIAPKHILESIDLLFERFKSHQPNFHIAPPKNKKSNGTMAVAGILDAHFGKYAHRDESGENYDLGIAESRFANAVEDIIERASHRKIDQWLFPIGNDAIHVDSAENTTTSGTAVDTDGRIAKVFVTAKMAIINGIERMLKVAPIRVFRIPGNHDELMSLVLADSIASWYRSTPHVTVDKEVQTRRYIRHGHTLLGFTHGNNEKFESLPGLMAQEARIEWGQTEHHEWLVGHHHREGKWMTRSVQTTDATVIRVLPSISSTDEWHFRKGFTGSRKAAMALYYDFQEGHVGYDIVTARDE